jgi:hypothetical protein
MGFISILMLLQDTMNLTAFSMVIDYIQDRDVI